MSFEQQYNSRNPNNYPLRGRVCSFELCKSICFFHNALLSSVRARSLLKKRNCLASQWNAPNSRPRPKLTAQRVCGICSIHKSNFVGNKQRIRSSIVVRCLKFTAPRIRITITYGKLLHMPMIINSIHPCRNLHCTNKWILIDALKSFSEFVRCFSLSSWETFYLGWSTVFHFFVFFFFVCFHGSFLQNEIYLHNAFNRDSHLALRCRLFDGSAAIVCVDELVRSTDWQSHLRIGECAVRTALSRWNDGFICSTASSVESLDHRTYRSCVSFRFACQSYQVIHWSRKRNVSFHRLALS